MKRLLPCLLLPLALAGCESFGGSDSALPPGQAASAGVTGFTVLGTDGSVNAVWTNTGGTSWSAQSPRGERIATQEIGRDDCCISFATTGSAVADFEDMDFTITRTGTVVDIVDVVRQ